ncbi:hypothetical protein Misp01_17120 [Microtetraspora sp. NBRC 13810]|uniref:ATP-binding protein n=1 Tax=Microtetraspora sp. NBRC 13810 TaxID=3030990 RepID=UPI0024A5E2BC|nr:ATP-binding protein [Microtetraspora sp. NBRC 13810]GLW06582.1 hypothetical protein Misp01_17120 [Microtetraspora sp. NBRC 13810]
MYTRIALQLPRDASSVPLIRRLLDATLRTLGVVPQIRDDIQIILSEACSNVVRHAVPSVEYTVQAMVEDDRCVIEITDAGGGFDPGAVKPSSTVAENGRGLQIMRALADELDVADVGGGTRVSVAKALHFCADAPAQSLHRPLARH